MIRATSPSFVSRRPLFAGLVALLSIAACDREVLLDEAQPAGPAMARARVSSQGIGIFGVTGMNEAGDMVGNTGSQAYRWTAAGGTELLPSAGSWTAALDINASGTAAGRVGEPGDDEGDYHIAIWPADGGVQVARVPEGWKWIDVTLISDAGVVLGTANMPDFSDRAFRWSPRDGFQLLELAGSGRIYGTGSIYSEHVTDINAAGDVLGYYEEGCYSDGPAAQCENGMNWYDVRAVVWKSDGSIVPLSPLSSTSHSRAYDLTDSGVAVGCTDTEAVRWTPDGAVHTLGVEGCAVAVNEAGAVAGWYGSLRHKAFRWTETDGAVDLAIPGGDQAEAADLNEAGDVTGWGLNAAGARRGFLWTPQAGMQVLEPLAGFAWSEGRFVNDRREVGGISATGTYYAPDAQRATRWYDVVVNEAPVAYAGGPYGGRVSGRRYVYDASASSDADGTGLRYSWDMNADGTFDGVTNNPLFGYTYPAGGTYLIRLVVLDDGGRADTTITSARVAQNVAPVISAVTGMPTSRGEGLPITLTPTVTDANQSVDSSELSLMRYRWDWGDGATSTARVTTHAYADQGTYTVRLIVTDAGGLADTVTRTAAIENVAPTGRLVTPNSVGEGTAFTLSATTLADASADVAAGLQVAFDCGGGFGAYGTATSIVCPARPDQGSVTVRMRVKDKDGAASEATKTIPVGNVAPRVTASAASPTTFGAGGTFGVSATFTDVAADAPWRYRIYWGDGAYTPLTNVAGGATITGSHAYAAPGTYAVQVAVADKDGGSGRSTAITVTVTP